MNILLPGGDAVPPSIAVSPDDRHWLLLNASAGAVHEARLRCAAADGTIAAVVLLDRHFDHTAGLPALCDDTPLDVYTTPAVFEGLAEAAPTLGLLDGRCLLRWHLLPVAGDVRSAEFRIPGVDALHCRVLAADDSSAPGERVLIEVDDRRTGQCLVYAGGERPRWIEAGREHGT